jgi:AcrR family transcriptional regulator
MSPPEPPPDEPAQPTPRGGAARGLEILWGLDDPPTRGPKATLTRDAIVRAAVEIADRDGIDAVSMRAVAVALEVGTMSLYRHVPGKDELVALMVDHVNGEVVLATDVTAGWRARLEHTAREEWALHHRHPWMLQVPFGRTAPGPNAMASFDAALAAAAQTGLPSPQVVSIVSSVLFLVIGAARSSTENLLIEQRTGVSNAEWWQAQDTVLRQVMDPQRFPTLLAIHQAGALTDAEPTNVTGEGFAADFEVAMGLLLDGVEALVARRG